MIETRAADSENHWINQLCNSIINISINWVDKNLDALRAANAHQSEMRHRHHHETSAENLAIITRKLRWKIFLQNMNYAQQLQQNWSQITNISTVGNESGFIVFNPKWGLVIRANPNPNPSESKWIQNSVCPNSANLNLNPKFWTQSDSRFVIPKPAPGVYVPPGSWP